MGCGVAKGSEFHKAHDKGNLSDNLSTEERKETVQAFSISTYDYSCKFMHSIMHNN